MENSKPKSDSLWAKFVDSFDDYMSSNPFVDIDEAYMTSQQKQNMYADAAAELKAKIKLIKEQKKSGISNKDKNSEKDV
tara:strand:+ start:210 stop:446 length:237 start_codon:yes stop_codon:yes gene_type:complete